MHHTPEFDQIRRPRFLETCLERPGEDLSRDFFGRFLQFMGRAEPFEKFRHDLVAHDRIRVIAQSEITAILSLVITVPEDAAA